MAWNLRKAFEQITEWDIKPEHDRAARSAHITRRQNVHRTAVTRSAERHVSVRYITQRRRLSKAVRMIETTIIALQGKNTRTREECADRSGLSDAVIAVNHRATRGPSSGKTRSAKFATSVKTTDKTSETINHCTR